MNYQALFLTQESDACCLCSYWPTKGISDDKKDSEVRKTSRLKRPQKSLLLIRIVMVVARLANQIYQAKTQVDLVKNAFICGDIRKTNRSILRLLMSTLSQLRKTKSKVIGT